MPRGGKRKDSGRKSVPEELKLKHTIRINDKTKEILETIVPGNKRLGFEFILNWWKKLSNKISN